MNENSLILSTSHKNYHQSSKRNWQRYQTGTKDPLIWSFVQDWPLQKGFTDIVSECMSLIIMVLNLIWEFCVKSCCFAMSFWFKIYCQVWWLPPQTSPRLLQMAFLPPPHQQTFENLSEENSPCWHIVFIPVRYITLTFKQPYKTFENNMGKGENGVMSAL